MKKCASKIVVVAAVTVLSCQPARSELPHPNMGSPLVLAIVIDQLGAAELERYLPYLKEDGAIRTGIAKGGFFPRVAYPYAGTYTAPGHTTIFCGASPSHCGVVANRVWDRKRGVAKPVMDSGRHKILGRPDRHASPRRIIAKTVADKLKDATNGRGKVVSLSIKDRAAIPGGGHRPDLTLWFDSKAGGFTTSDYYMPELPQWLRAWRAKNPFEQAMQPWEPQDRAVLKSALGADAQPGEGQCLGVTSSFPYDPKKSDNPDYIFKMTPFSTGYLLDLARAAVTEYELGRDTIPDLLAISVSAVDYAGHVFGPHSWEYLETLIQADAALGEFIAELSLSTDVSVLITSDHGVAPMPERTGTGGRIFAPTFADELEKELADVLGPGDWIAGYSSPFFYLSEAGLARKDDVVKSAIALLEARPTVDRAFDVGATLGRGNDDDPLTRAVARSLFAGQGGEIFVVPAEFFIVDEAAPKQHGTSHGTPWDYDRLVPVVAWGTGIAQGTAEQQMNIEQVAPSLSAMLRIQPPAQSVEPSLFATTK